MILNKRTPSRHEGMRGGGGGVELIWEMISEKIKRTLQYTAYCLHIFIIK